MPDGANGKQASATYSNGIVYSWVYNADGSLHEFVQNYIAWETVDDNRHDLRTERQAGKRKLA